MVVSKSGALVHPRPCIKEAMLPVGHGVLMGSGPVSNYNSSTLPRVRAVTRRVAELPSLRYGTVGAGCTVSGPLRVRDTFIDSSLNGRHQPPTPTVVRKYNRSFTTSVVEDDIPTLRSTMHQTRRVRFDLPPPEDLYSERTGRSATIPTPDGANNNSGVGFNSWMQAQSHATLPSSRYYHSSSYSSRPPSLSSNRSTPRLSYTQRAPPVACVTVVSTTTPVRERAHPVGTYVRGTLSPTAHVAEGAVVPDASLQPTPLLLRAAKESDDGLLREAIRSAQGGVGLRDVNAVDSSGRTALSYVASNGPVDLLEAMVHLPGSDPNLPDNEGNTPLHFAAQAGQVECLNFLLSRCQGLEIDARNHLGFTPLMKAALQGRNKCAKLLLFAGANPTLRDTGRGLRAEQWARYCGRYVCADVIEKFARHRLLERSTSCGRWGSESDIGGTRILLGKVVPVPPPHVPTPVPSSQSQGKGIKSKLRKVFRTSSGPSSDSASSARLVTQLTSAALCASTPVLPAAPTVPPVVKSLIRPLTVPRLQITLANGGATLSSDINGLSSLLDQENQQNIMEKPPRSKKKMK